MRRLAKLGFLVVLAACGGGGSGDDGADDDDDGVDAGVVFDPATQVRVTATDFGDRKVAGADVWSHDATGAQLGHTTTDADGEAIVAMTSGGAVTLHNVGTAGEVWNTTVAVEPGDLLAMKISEPGEYGGENPVTFQRLVMLPAPPAGTARIALASPCASGAASLAGNGMVTATCTGPTTLVATAFDNGNHALAYEVFRDLDLMAAVNVTTAAAWTPATLTWTVEVKNPPADLRYASVTRIAGEHGASVLANGITTNDVTAVGFHPALEGAPTYDGFAGLYNGGHRLVFTTTEAADDGIVLDFDTIGWPGPFAHGTDGNDFTWSAVSGAAYQTLRLQVAEGTGDVVGNESTWTVTLPPDRASFHFFTDVGFPFAATTTPPTRVYAAGVRATTAAWLPPYTTLRLGAPEPAPPALYTRSVGYAGYDMYNPEQ
jgi:hypothetical protein